MGKPCFLLFAGHCFKLEHLQSLVNVRALMNQLLDQLSCVIFKHEQNQAFVDIQVALANLPPFFISTPFQRQLQSPLAKSKFLAV